MRSPDPLSNEAVIITQDRPVSAVLRIGALGQASIKVGDAPVQVQTRKSRALLAYLALRPDGSETRERLVGLFWSESDESRARTSLRQTLSELRRGFGAHGVDGIEADKLSVALSRGFTSDVAEAIADAEAGRAGPGVLHTARLAETLLDGFDDIDPSFRLWLLARRQTLHERLVSAYERHLRDPGNAPDARATAAQALLALEETHEEACRFLMETKARQGDTPGALRLYRTMWTVLGDEYGMEPTARTQDLVVDIKQGAFDEQRGHPPAPAEPAPPARSARALLVVGPFARNGAGDDRSHLVDGFRHHLIASLVRFREWSVVEGARPESDARKPERDAEYTVEATAYSVASAVHLVLTLRDAGTGAFVWSDAFDLDIETWFESQQRIVRRIAVTLNVQLSTERLRRLAPEPDVALDVYDRWLRGQAMINGFGRVQWERAERLFREIVRDAPDFSPAYSSLVQMNNAIHIVHPGVRREAARAQETLALARTAVQLDPLDSRAQLCLGWAYAMDKQHDMAGLHMDLARDLNGNDAWTLISVALFHAFAGRHDLARTIADEALRISLAPSRTHWAYQVSIRFLGGDYLGTIEAADRAADCILTLPAWRAAALARLDRRDEAARDVGRFHGLVQAGWHGPKPFSTEASADWLLHLYPIANAADWDGLRDAMAAAGIRTAIAHGDW